MANLIWRGDAKAVAQVVRVTPQNPEPGDTFTITINGKDIQFVAADSSVGSIVDGLVASWNAAIFPEAAAITAAAVDSDDDGVSDYLTLTADVAGVPFRVSTSTSDAGGFTIDVTTLIAGDPGQNEIQRITIPSVSSGGTFTLTFAGQTTGNIAYNANAATVETALEALSNIAAGDVEVTGASPEWFVEFKQAYANENVPLLTGSGANLTGSASIVHNTTTEGSGGVNEIQEFGHDPQIDTVSPNLEGFRIQIFGQITSALPHNPTADAVQSAMEALSSVGVGNVFVSLSGSPNAATYTVEFVGDLGNQSFPGGGFLILEVDSSASASATVTQEGSSSVVDEVQTVKINGSPTGGTFTLTFQGQTTGTIAYDADAATVETALEALSNITAVSVSKSGTTYTITFTDPGGADLAQMTSDASSLTGGFVAAVTTQNATDAANEVQQIAFSQTPGGGTFTLTWDPGAGDETTGNIDFDATAAEVQTALEGLATPGAGDFSVSGDDGGPWLVEFQSTYAATDVNAIEGSGANLTGGGSQSMTVSTTTRSQGPNHFDDPDNWTGEAVPDSQDSVFYSGGAVNCLWGIRQRTTFTADAGTDVITFADLADFVEGQKVRLFTTNTLPAGLSTGTDYFVLDLDYDAGTCQLEASLGGGAVNITDVGTGTHTIALHLTAAKFNSRWSGGLGLPERSGQGFYEYRPRSLAAVIDAITIGEGEGAGQPRLDIDTGLFETAITVFQTGGSEEEGLPAIRWRGTHASNTLTLYDGECGVAIYATESAQLASLAQYAGILQMGTVTIGDIEKHGGELTAQNATVSGTLQLFA